MQKQNLRAIVGNPDQGELALMKKGGARKVMINELNDFSVSFWNLLSDVQAKKSTS
jgi:hypothetical protein